MRAPSATLLVLATLLSASLGCSGSVTELVVRVESDLPVAGQLDEVRISIDGVVGGPATAVAALSGTGATTLPGTLGVVHTAGPLGPVTVTASGYLRGALVVSRVARTSFVEGRTVVLQLDLLRSCRGTTCPIGETCAATGCRSIDVPASSLPEWPLTSTSDAGALDTGTIDAAPIDAGATDAGPPDAGPADSGPRDAGSPDAGRTCDSIYGAGMDYQLCSETATTCRIAATTAGGSCNDFCTMFGGTCISAEQNGTAPPFCTSTGGDMCRSNRTNNICVCSR